MTIFKSLFGRKTEIGVLFDIDELDTDLYGQAAWAILMKTLDPVKIRDSILFSGDTSIPGKRQPSSFCIGIETTTGEQIEYFRNILNISHIQGLFPLKQRFIHGQIIDRYSLTIDGHIDPHGRFVMANTGCYWLCSVASNAGWKYLPSDNWLGEFTAELLERYEPDALPLSEEFKADMKKALKEAGKTKTLHALNDYLKKVKDDELNRICQKHLRDLEKIWL